MAILFPYSPAQNVPLFMLIFMEGVCFEFKKHFAGVEEFLICLRIYP